MCEHHNRRAVGNRLEIIFHPFELLIAELAQATFANRHHVVQADEVRALVVEAEPALSLRTFAKPFEVLFAVVVEHVVFAGDIKHLLRFAGLENLLERVELIFLWFSYFCVFLVLIHAVYDSRREKLFHGNKILLRAVWTGMTAKREQQRTAGPIRTPRHAASRRRLQPGAVARRKRPR